MLWDLEVLALDLTNSTDCVVACSACKGETLPKRWSTVMDEKVPPCSNPLRICVGVGPRVGTVITSVVRECKTCRTAQLDADSSVLNTMPPHVVNGLPFDPRCALGGGTVHQSQVEGSFGDDGAPASAKSQYRRAHIINTETTRLFTFCVPGGMSWEDVHRLLERKYAQLFDDRAEAWNSLATSVFLQLKSLGVSTDDGWCLLDPALQAKRGPLKLAWEGIKDSIMEPFDTTDGTLRTEFMRAFVPSAANLKEAFYYQEVILKSVIEPCLVMTGRKVEVFTSADGNHRMGLKFQLQERQKGKGCHHQVWVVVVNEDTKEILSQHLADSESGDALAKAFSSCPQTM